MGEDGSILGSNECTEVKMEVKVDALGLLKTLKG